MSLSTVTPRGHHQQILSQLAMMIFARLSHGNSSGASSGHTLPSPSRALHSNLLPVLVLVAKVTNHMLAPATGTKLGALFKEPTSKAAVNPWAILQTMDWK